MAKTNSNVDRDQKRDDILRVAKRQFLEVGFEATSIHSIVDEVRVAPNTLYWYFADKDTLLIAVLDVLVSEAFGELEQRKSASLESQLLWVLDKLSDAQRLITTVHTRMATVERVHAWHEGFHTLVEATIEQQLRSRALASGHENDAARTTMFVIEGLLSHPCPPKQQRALLKWLVSLVQRNKATRSTS